MSQFIRHEQSSWLWTAGNVRNTIFSPMVDDLTVYRSEILGEEILLICKNKRIIYAGWREDPLFSNNRKTLPPQIVSRFDDVTTISMSEVQFNTSGVHVFGTAFQLVVWREMLNVTIGKTISYSELAKRAGMPSSVRAVARACAANPLLWFIPCHRIVAKNGAIGGFRGGTKWKENWLRIERKIEKEKL